MQNNRTGIGRMGQGFLSAKKILDEIKAEEKNSLLKAITQGMFSKPQETQSYQLAQQQLPSILQSIQSQMGQRPVMQVPQGNSGSLLGNLSTHGAQMIRKGQTLNPTILKAKVK